MPKKAPSAKEYLDGIDVSKVTSGLWDPTKQWNRLHVDGKSTTGGAYHIETILGSDGVFKAKVAGSGDSAKVEVTRSRASLLSLRPSRPRPKAT